MVSSFTLLYMGTKKKDKLEVVFMGNIFDMVHQTHEVTVAHCAYCDEPLTESDVNDYGSLCESCYMEEYYGQED